MNLPLPTVTCSEQTLARLFNGRQANFQTWMEQTRANGESLTHASPLEPVFLSSNLRAKSDHAALLQICENIQKMGFAFYQWNDQPQEIEKAVQHLLHNLQLRDVDQGVIRELSNLSLLQDMTGTPKERFPPYQPKHMNWHTDGYYNAPENQVRCFTLHCVEPAAEGGSLLLLDDALFVLALLHEDPNLVELLSHPEAMTLPHNKDNEGHDRPDRTVPIILQNPDNTLCMRFTMRTKNIHWRNEATQNAAQRAAEMLKANTQWHTRITLKKGQGVITRNVLHAREQFVDAPEQPKRQMLRGRFTSLPKFNKLIDETHSSMSPD